MRLFSSAGLYLTVALLAPAITALHLPLLSANPLHRIYQQQEQEAAAPAPGVERTPCCAAQSQFQPTYRAQYTCGPTTLVNHTQASSPLFADCQMLLANVTGTPGYYNISHWPGDSVLSPFMTNNTCQLVVGKMGSDLSQNATIGNGDIEKFISMMLNQQNGTCSQTGRCSAWGVTSCYSSTGANVGITWELTQPMP